jgi:ABC-2 type transport system ATP-binding protein
MDAPMISIEGLTKHYGPTPAVRGISFEVPKGQVVGFLGPNGAGKSTTMKILTGYVQPTGGAVRVAGISVPDDPVEARRHIGYLPENNPLYEDMMVDEYLGYIAAMRDVPADRRGRAITVAVERCGLGAVRGKDIGELSKGFRQRVGLAQAILHDPDLLILDEPTTGLDPNQVVEIRNLIRDLGKEKTVILSTHVLPEVQHMCSRAVIIAEGKIVADGAPDALSAEGGTVHVVIGAREGALARARVAEMLRALEGVVEVHERPAPEKAEKAEKAEGDVAAFTLATRGKADPRRALFDAVVAEKLVLLGLEHRQLSLEETFRKLTTSESSTANNTASQGGAS